MVRRRDPFPLAELCARRYAYYLGRLRPSELGAGLTAYFEYHQMLHEFAEDLGLPTAVVCGVFACLSPNSHFMSNLRSTVTLCRGYRSGGDYSRLPVTTYGQNKRRAWLVLQGRPMTEVVRGLKLLNFYQNLLNPGHPTAVTVDGHMASIARGKYLTMSEAGVTPKQYNILAEALRQTADKHRLLPSQLQAGLWFYWKRRHQVYATSQLPLGLEGEREFSAYVDARKIPSFVHRDPALTQVPANLF